MGHREEVEALLERYSFATVLKDISSSAEEFAEAVGGESRALYITFAKRLEQLAEKAKEFGL